MTSFVVRPGTVSCFWPNSGTQKEWTTSSDLRRSSTLRPTGRRRSPEVRSLWPGYEKLHANCCAVTSTCIGFRPALPFFASTIALTIAIATTSAVGIAVHVISSPVWPWIGGPSDSSSGAARNFQIEYPIPAFAVHATTSAVNVNTVGWILMVVGGIGILLSLIFWSSWAGPGYFAGR